MIDTIVFDVGGVIVPLDKDRCIDAFTQLGVEDFYKCISDYKQKGFFAAFENGDIDTDTFRDEVKKISSKQIENDILIDKALHQFLLPVLKSTAECIVNLSEKYKLYILSNNNPIAWEKCVDLFSNVSKYKIEDLFETIFLSFEINKSKPQKNAFEHVIVCAGIEPTHTLYVDDAQPNINMAEELGFNTLLFNSKGDFKQQVLNALVAKGDTND